MITMKRALTSGLYGVGDIATEYLDAKQGYTQSFKRITDWYRVAGVGGGLLLSYKGYGQMAELGEVLFYSGLPLLEKSLKNLADPYMDVRALSTRGVPLRTTAPRAGLAGMPATAANSSKRGAL